MKASARSDLSSRLTLGAIAQLGERLLCKQEVVGSIPSGSTSRVAVARPRALRSRRELRQAIDRLVRKLIFSPRRHRKIRRCGLSDIVKRRSLRAFGRDENLARRAISSIKTQCASGMETFSGEHRVRCLSSCCLTAEDVGTVSKQAGLSNQCPPRRVAWVLIMRAIKCLKGIRWMPWR